MVVLAQVQYWVGLQLIYDQTFFLSIIVMYTINNKVVSSFDKNNNLYVQFKVYFKRIFGLILATSLGKESVRV